MIKVFYLLAFAAGMGSVAPSYSASLPALSYTTETKGPVPIPPSERTLQTITAQPYFKVSDKGLQLEGAVFDLQGDLRFVDVFGDRVYRLTRDLKLTSFATPPGFAPAGLAVHKDGRLFIAGLGNFKDSGGIIATKADGSDVETIIPPSAGFLVDDLDFDAKGGFYFTDFRGNTSDPKGGVLYVSPDGKTITPVLPNLAVANGVAIGPDGKTLWADELSAGALHKVELSDATTIAPFGTSIPYHFIGPAPDSMRVDSDGNVYVAIYGQGRILVFNSTGIPIGQILIPGRETGHNLRSTSMAFRPGTNELLILASDAQGGQGCSIYHVTAFAKGASTFAHP
ncbi:SMP-30/gluconolactonase/LRE family protein [Sphingomonas abietis]|uniref:SMP-30/gluconolactonase/LRE family protein n=1 Tax=Sphingomonas abietis TaxID=3012344 RepID=A0ABY7NIM8_9SPHN|nr:SMP-30/gluconolactonase/LRE family protein [Sphingomonas abietis]WBO21334.1 SMP-30/gluconolactonase/LRE family protein [Sphingomonas abietis]